MGKKNKKFKARPKVQNQPVTSEIEAVEEDVYTEEIEIVKAAGAGRSKLEKSKPKKEKKRGRFFRKMKEVFSELKKVSWPTFKTVVKQTCVVLVVVIFFLAIIYGADTLLAFGLRSLTSG
jgi:preprotein translocase SecE subunit